MRWRNKEGNLVSSDDSKTVIHSVGGQYCSFWTEGIGKALLLCFEILVGSQPLKNGPLCSGK